MPIFGNLFGALGTATTSIGRFGSHVAANVLGEMMSKETIRRQERTAHVAATRAAARAFFAARSNQRLIKYYYEACSRDAKGEGRSTNEIEDHFVSIFDIDDAEAREAYVHYLEHCTDDELEHEFDFLKDNDTQAAIVRIGIRITKKVKEKVRPGGIAKALAGVNAEATTAGIRIHEAVVQGQQWMSVRETRRRAALEHDTAYWRDKEPLLRRVTSRAKGWLSGRMR
ncbi:MAG: hypothetical protein HY460_02405 [Parcubacteria group bacterium]|nr:hypothetical protein [Parcubacteria group bacterium]